MAAPPRTAAVSRPAAPAAPRRVFRNADVGLAMAVVGLLVILVVPLPTWLLDLLIVVNLSASILLLLLVLSSERPLDLSTFPTLLLFGALFRLALNVASTRLILLDGHAGRVIESFGKFVVGGNLVVGIVIFLILIVIQFVVITKGAGASARSPPFHPRRDARQADGDRRRAQQRPDRHDEAKARRREITARRNSTALTAPEFSAATPSPA